MPVSSLNYNIHGKKLKPSLKLSKKPSISSFVSSTPSNSFSPVEDSTPASSSASSSSSGKSVRFATHLCTVKKFNTKLAPISISERARNVPNKYTTSYPRKILQSNSAPLNFPLIGNEDRLYSFDILDCSDLEYDDKDYEDENESDVEDNAVFLPHRNLCIEKESLGLGKEDNVDIADWKLIGSNLNIFKNNKFVNLAELESNIFQYLNGQNIKVYSLRLSEPVSHEDICHNNFGSCQISGLIFVNNLSFEKTIEIKFTLNNWSDIHYINASFKKSITSRIDEFEFVIDISALKLNLVSKNLIFTNMFEKKTICSLNLQFCCRYDVNNFNNRTFYDNNDYKNYEVKISLTAMTLNHGVSKIPKHDSHHTSFSLRDRNCSVHLPKNNESVRKPLRKFNDDTDYFNDSPLKHKFHRSFEIKPACEEVHVPSTIEAGKNHDKMKPFRCLVGLQESQMDGGDISDSSNDLSLQDFNCWEFTNHGLGKVLADSDILQFKNYPKPELLSRHPLMDSSFTSQTDNSTMRLKPQELESSLSDENKFSVASASFNGMSLCSDGFRAPFGYSNWNDSTDTLMKKKDRLPVESVSPSELSITTIKMEENLQPQENIIGDRMCSSPTFLPLNDSTPPPFFSGDNMSDSSREYEDTFSLDSNEVHFLGDYFSKSPSLSPSPIFL